MDTASLVVSVIFWKRKAYRYLLSSALCLFYSILFFSVNKSPAALTDTAVYEILCICEKVFPAILLIAVIMLCRKQIQDVKRNYAPCCIAGAICAVRIARFVWVRYLYIDLLRNSGDAVLELTHLGVLSNNIYTILMYFLFFLLSIALIWHMKKYGPEGVDK